MRAELDALLEKTSRTFALAIPELPEPTRLEVTLAYLLFRIADTLEDATRWPPEIQQEALLAFGRALDEPEGEEIRDLARAWQEAPPLAHAGDLQLLERAPLVFHHFAALDPAARDIIRRHVRRTAEGMSRFVGRPGNGHPRRIHDLDDLRAYCHVVAGIVGEMLTELFVLGRAALRPVADDLWSRASAFGEGLQLTNILKDASVDVSEGRSFVPAGVPRARVFAVAREDLGRAAEYVRILEEASAPPGIVSFCAVPVALAWGTLDRVEAQGPGAKLTRHEVFARWQHVHESLATGRPALDGLAARTG